MQHHGAISENKFDLGRARTVVHKITLKTEEPFFVPQFQIQDAQMKEVEKHLPIVMAQTGSQ